MLYSILIYDSELYCGSLSETENEERLKKHRSLQKHLEETGKLGPIAKLLPSTTSVTLRTDKNEDLIITDGPFAETKEQLLGFYVVDCDSLEDAIAAAKQLPIDSGSIEVRPVEWSNLNSINEQH